MYSSSSGRLKRYVMAGQSPSIFKHRWSTDSGDFRSSDKTSSGSNDDEPSVYGLFIGGDIVLSR